MKTNSKLNLELPFVLFSIDEYREKAFGHYSKPDPRVVRNWINTGALAGQKIGKIYYVKVYKETLRNEHF